jgi:two-component system LytT family response regulator
LRPVESRMFEQRYFQRVLADRTPTPSQCSILLAERSRRLFFLAAADIDYIQSCSNYLSICARGETYLRRGTLAQAAEQLRPFGFIRIRRSTVINVTRIQYAERLARGRFRFVLHDGTQLASSERFRTEILSFGLMAGAAHGPQGRAEEQSARSSSTPFAYEHTTLSDSRFDKTTAHGRISA